MEENVNFNQFITEKLTKFNKPDKGVEIITRSGAKHRGGIKEIIKDKENGIAIILWYYGGDNPHIDISQIESINPFIFEKPLRG